MTRNVFVTDMAKLELHNPQHSQITWKIIQQSEVYLISLWDQNKGNWSSECNNHRLELLHTCFICKNSEEVLLSVPICRWDEDTDMWVIMFRSMSNKSQNQIPTLESFSKVSTQTLHPKFKMSHLLGSKSTKNLFSTNIF